MRPAYDACYFLHYTRLASHSGGVLSTRDTFNVSDQCLSSSTMAKRYGDLAYGLNVTVKKRRGVLVRTVNVPDSDDDDSPPGTKTEYARTLKTRVTTSGKAGSTTTSALQVFKAEDPPRDSPELIIDGYDEVMVDNIQRSMTETVRAKIRRKKQNDSVSPFQYRLIHSHRHHTRLRCKCGWT